MIVECKKSILRTQREETNSMRLCTFLLVAATLLTAAEISLSQKDGKKGCSAAGHVRMESSSEQQVAQDPCATARITTVQICEDTEWKAICGEQSTDANIKVLCKAKGYSTIGANISTMSQVIGSAISTFILNCNGSEAKPDDCLLERQTSAFTNCRRTIIQCFVADPDPQLCNIFFPTTTPEHTITVSDSTTTETSVTPPLASTTSISLEAPSTDLSLVRYATAAEANHENISSITNMPTIGLVIGIMTVMLMCLASLLVTVCFVVRRRKEARQKGQTERSKLKQKDSQTLDDASQYAVITECKQESQRQGMEHVYQYTNNNAYGSRPMQNSNFNQCPSSVTLSSDQQQDMEPVYETIPGSILKSHTTV